MVCSFTWVPLLRRDKAGHDLHIVLLQQQLQGISRADIGRDALSVGELKPGVMMINIQLHHCIMSLMTLTLFKVAGECKMQEKFIYVQYLNTCELSILL